MLPILIVLQQSPNHRLLYFIWNITTTYSKEDFLVTIIFMSIHFPRANSKGFIMLHVLQKVLRWIFSSLFSLFFLLIRTICIEILHVLHKTQVGFLWNCKTYIQDIQNKLFTNEYCHPFLPGLCSNCKRC